MTGASVRGAAILALVVTCGVVSVAYAAGSVEGIVDVRTSDELLAILTSAKPGTEVHMRRGTYEVDRPVLVPDGVALVGEGIMRTDANGVAVGIEPDTATVLAATPRLDGDLLTLGNGSRVSGLVLRDVVAGPVNDATRDGGNTDSGDAARDGDAPRRGNVVAVVSRAAADVVAATIVDCEVDSPNPPDFTPLGPTGRGITTVVRDSFGQATQHPHAGATLRLTVSRTVVHGNANAVAVFVANFAPAAKTYLTLSHNRIEGSLVAVGGATRLDAVEHALADIESDHNLFVAPEGSQPAAWALFGGSSSPHIETRDRGGPRFNTLRIRSMSDRIDGFVVGITGAAGRRVFANSGEVDDNRLELDLTVLHVRTIGDGAADLELYGALAQPDPSVGSEFPIGDRNTLYVRMDGSRGSGLRANTYATDMGPVNPVNRRLGNRIEFEGSLAAFTHSNAAIEPAPPAQYFVGAP